MDAILLRTLSFKSIFWFGQYNGMSVNQLITIHKGSYLKWIYFNIEGISFTDEVLDKIKLFPDVRIKKPGVYPEKWKEYVLLQRKVSCGLEGHINKIRNKSRLRARYVSTNKSNQKSYFKKSILQSKNQGH